MNCNKRERLQCESRLLSIYNQQRSHLEMENEVDGVTPGSTAALTRLLRSGSRVLKGKPHP